MKSFSARQADVKRQWYLVDAAQMPLGRLATLSAGLLMGKDKPTFTPHIDGGDYVIVINADLVAVSGAKEGKKIYYRHSGYPGGLYKRTLAQQKQRDSSKIITKAIRGMLPANKLRAQRMVRLKVYPKAEHTHRAQNPVLIKANKRAVNNG